MNLPLSWVAKLPKHEDLVPALVAENNAYAFKAGGKVYVRTKYGVVQIGQESNGNG